MEEKSFKAICLLLAEKAVRLNLLESIFLAHSGISCWFYTDSDGVLRSRNIAKTRLRTTQDLLAHLIEDYKSREQFDSSITGKLCWLRNSSSRRLLEFSQVENLGGKNASMIQVKLVQRYLSSFNSSEATYLLSMNYLDSTYVSKFHKLANKVRTPFKHPRLYSKALSIAKTIIRSIEEVCQRRVLSFTSEFMLDRDGQMLLIHSSDCRLVDLQICLQMPIKSEADMASLKNMINRRSNKTLNINKPAIEINSGKPNKAYFKHGQLRNDESFNGVSIPFKLNLDSILCSPAEEISPDASPRILKAKPSERTKPLTWAFNLRKSEGSAVMFDRGSQKKLTEATRSNTMRFETISDDFAEILVKTFERHSKTPSLPRFVTSETKDLTAKQPTCRIRSRFSLKNKGNSESKALDHEPKVSNSYGFTEEILSKSKEVGPGALRSGTSMKIRKRSMILTKLFDDYSAKQLKSSTQVIPELPKTHGSQMSSKSQSTRFKSPYLSKN